MAWSDVLALVDAIEAEGALRAAQGAPGALTAEGADELRAKLQQLRELRGAERISACQELYKHLTRLQAGEVLPAVHALSTVVAKAFLAWQVAIDLELGDW